MDIKKHLLIAMAKKGIEGKKNLAEISGLSYAKTVRALSGDTSLKIVDIVKLADCLDLKLKFVSKGE